MVNLKKLLTQILGKVERHENKLSSYPSRLMLGTYVYSGTSTGTIVFSDSRVAKANYVIASGCRGADCAMRFGWVKLHHNSKSFNSGYYCANQLSAVGILTAIPIEGVRAC